MYRRLVSLMLACALLFCATACGADQGGTDGGTSVTTTTSNQADGADIQQHEIYAQEGVHHVAIIYSCNRNSKAMEPFVARMKDGKPTGEYLFDTYIYLQLLNTSGMFGGSAGAKKANWENCLKRYFREDNDILSLEGALENLEPVIGAPETKRKVIISIPYPHKKTENFGDVDGDGVDEDFLDDNDRKKVLQWFVNEAIERFNSYNFKHIELWGFYWDTEEIPSDEIAVSMASEVVHDAGYKFMWIPYYEAPGYEKGNDYFDVTIMQPNYSFNDWTVDGKVGPERLENAWETCQKYGYGIEMELDTNSLGDVANFQRYMAYGAADRLEYQFHTNGYFLGLGGRFIEKTHGSTIESDVAIYDMLCDYITGKKVPDPDVYYPVSWDGNPLELEAKTTDRISNVLVSADTKTLGDWSGVISAEFYRDGKWVEAGWLAVESDATAQAIRTLTIPTEGTAEKVRLSVKGGGTFPDKAIRSLSLDHTGARTEVNYCYGKSYTITDEEVYRPYDDDGTKLTDTVMTGNGLAWWDRPARLVVDLGSAKEVDTLELYVREQLGAGISLPQLTYAAFSEDKPAEMVRSGIGALPTNFRMVQGKTVEADKGTSFDKIYRIEFKTQKQKTRYISLYVEPTAARWMMMTEVCVKSGGTEIPIASYTLKTRTQAELGTTKTDTGVQLTNGAVEYELGNGCVAWDTKYVSDPKEVVVDLEQSETIHEITVYTVWSVLSKVYGANKVVFYTSEDGAKWTEQGTVEKSNLEEEAAALYPVTPKSEIAYPVSFNCRLKQATQARYLKVIITPRDSGTCAISEITAS